MKVSVIRLLALATLALGCNEIETTLRVENTPQRLKLNPSDRTDSVELEPGEYKIKLTIANHEDRASQLEFLDHEATQSKDFSIYGLRFSALQEIREPVTLAHDELKQPFRLRIERIIQEGDDYFVVVLSDPAESTPIAHFSFTAHGEDNQTNASTGEFLASYQRVRFAQRGIMYGIDYAIDNYNFPNGKMLDDLAHFASVLLIAPWVYARYPNVVWTIQDNSWNSEWLAAKWTKLIERSPVIDFIGAYHSEQAGYVLTPSQNLGRKLNQFRLFYTEGCNTGAAQNMLRTHNFASTIGYRAYSVSPLFTHALVRQWIYGHDLAEALKRASQLGHENVDFWGFDLLNKLWLDAYGYTPYQRGEADLHYQTEPMIAWTPEVPIDRMKIGLSASPKRDTEETQKIKVTDGFALRHHGAKAATESELVTPFEAYEGSPTKY